MHFKLDKYFNATDGVYPSLEFLKEVEYFYPLKAIVFSDSYGFCKIVGINFVNENERKTFKSLCRKFKSTLTGMIDCTIEGLQLECQNVVDFWKSNELLLPNLFALASRYCFMPNNSAAVERTFSFYYKLLSNERRNLEPKTLAETLFLYYNSGKI